MKYRTGLLEILAEAENDVENGRVAPICETFDSLRSVLQKSSSNKSCWFLNQRKSDGYADCVYCEKGKS